MGGLLYGRLVTSEAASPPSILQITTYHRQAMPIPIRGTISLLLYYLLDADTYL